METGRKKNGPPVNGQLQQGGEEERSETRYVSKGMGEKIIRDHATDIPEEGGDAVEKCGEVKLPLTVLVRVT